MKINGAAAHRPERERSRRHESRSPMEGAFAAQLEQRMPAPPPEPRPKRAEPPAAAASSAAESGAPGLSVDDLPPRMTMAPHDDGVSDGVGEAAAALALPAGADAGAAADAATATAAAVTMPAADATPAAELAASAASEGGADESTAGARAATAPAADAAARPRLDGASAAGVHVAHPAASAPTGAGDAPTKGAAADGTLALDVNAGASAAATPAAADGLVGLPAAGTAQSSDGAAPQSGDADAHRDAASLGARSQRDDRRAAGPAHATSLSAPPALAPLADVAAGGADAAPKVHAAAPVEIPQPPAHGGAARASITVGDGDDRVALHISANGAHIRVTAATASQQLANEMNRDAGDLRESLRQRGLHLSELHAGTSTDTASSQSHAREQPRDPDAPAPDGRHDGRIQTTSHRAKQPEPAPPTSARRVLA